MLAAGDGGAVVHAASIDRVVVLLQLITREVLQLLHSTSFLSVSVAGRPSWQVESCGSAVSQHALEHCTTPHAWIESRAVKSWHMLYDVTGSTGTDSMHGRDACLVIVGTLVMDAPHECDVAPLVRLLVCLLLFLHLHHSPAGSVVLHTQRRVVVHTFLDQMLAEARHFE